MYTMYIFGLPKTIGFDHTEEKYHVFNETLKTSNVCALSVRRMVLDTNKQNQLSYRNKLIFRTTIVSLIVLSILSMLFFTIVLWFITKTRKNTKSVYTY